MSLRDMVTDRAFLGFWRLEKIAGRAFLGERVLPLLGFPVTLFGSAKRRWENVRRQAQLDHVIAVVKHKTIRETAVCANNTPCNLNVEHLAAGRAGDDDAADRKSVGAGKSVSVRVNHGGGLIIKNKKPKKSTH